MPFFIELLAVIDMETVNDAILFYQETLLSQNSISCLTILNLTILVALLSTRTTNVQPRVLFLTELEIHFCSRRILFCSCFLF